MAKKWTRPWPNEQYIIVHWFDWVKHDFNICDWLDRAIDEASILTEKWYKCSISYTDEEWNWVKVM